MRRHRRLRRARSRPSVSEDGKNWYIIHTYSGFEQKVADSLRGARPGFRLRRQNRPDPDSHRRSGGTAGGKKVTSKRLLYPGYVLVQMEMNDQLWHEVKNTPRVTGFVGGGNSPVPLTADEVNSILLPPGDLGRAAAPEDEFREERDRADRRRTVRQLLGQGGRDQSGAQHFAGAGDHFWPATPVELDFCK